MGASERASDGRLRGLVAEFALPAGMNVFSKIASITIGGQVIGNLSNNALTYGFGAEEIGSFKVAGVALPLQAGKRNDIFTSAGVAGHALPVGPSLGNVVSDGFAMHIFEV